MTNNRNSRVRAKRKSWAYNHRHYNENDTHYPEIPDYIHPIDLHHKDAYHDTIMKNLDKTWFLYIISAQDKYYVGITIDPERRLSEHQSGRSTMSKVLGGEENTGEYQFQKVIMIGSFVHASRLERYLQNLLQFNPRKFRSYLGSQLAENAFRRQVLITLKTMKLDALEFAAYEQMNRVFEFTKKTHPCFGPLFKPQIPDIRNSYSASTEEKIRWNAYEEMIMVESRKNWYLSVDENDNIGITTKFEELRDPKYRFAVRVGAYYHASRFSRVLKNLATNNRKEYLNIINKTISKTKLSMMIERTRFSGLEMRVKLELNINIRPFERMVLDCETA